MKKIALLGCGAMGTQIALAIDSGKISANLTHVYDSSKKRAEELISKLKNPPILVENSHLLSSQNVDIVVEAASQDAVRDVSLSVLQNRKDLLIMSVGALLDESVFEILEEACKDFKKTIYLPSGAIAGIDGLKSVKNELETVTLTTIKHPRALRDAKFFKTSSISPDDIVEATIIFEGTAKEAVKLFPANINVAALLSIAGLGGEKTLVKIIADPATTRNTHKIEASGKFGKMTFVIENEPDEKNPKTSKLAILSAIEKLRQLCSNDIQVGT